MASIRKSFNFRNGIQVDSDNFIINANGLVGIGTSVPSEVLDVIGTLKVSDNIISSNINIGNLYSSGISTATKLLVNDYLNIGITSITSGIITSYSGVVTYYGDGGRLLNLPTSQWLDIDVGLGFTSIYAQGFVGIATDDPRHAFQIGGRYTNPSDLSTLVDGVGISSDGNIRLTGIITAGQFVGTGSLINDINADNITLGTLPNSRLANTVVLNNISSSGVITSSYFYGNLVGIASTARDITTESSIQITGLTVGVSTVSNILNIGGAIGVGTNLPNSDIHIFNSGISSAKITSTNNVSFLRIGRNSDGVDENGEIRFGNVDLNYENSTEKSLDIINYDDGNFNYYNNVSGGTGDFNWIRSLNINLMTLTSDGRLGIGITNPTNHLEVVGTGSITSDLYVGGNFSVIGNATLSGVFEVTDQINVTGTAYFNSLGVSTSGTTYDFQVGADPQSSNGGVGISSNGFIRIKNDIPIVRHINSSGIITATSLNSSGTITATSSITGSSFSGNGSSLTSLNASNISSGTLNNSRLPSAITITGNLSAANITATGSFSGNGSSLTSLNASNISSGTLNNSRLPSAISISGDINAQSGIYTGNLSAVDITGTTFSGNGSSLTSLNASNISSGTLNNSRLPSTISISGDFTAVNINGTTFSGNGSSLTNLNASNISSGNLSVSVLPSNYTGASINDADFISTNDLNVGSSLYSTAGISTFTGIIKGESDIYGDRFYNVNLGQSIRWTIDQGANTLTFTVGIPTTGYTRSVTLNLV